MKLSSKTTVAVSIAALILAGGATVAANASIPNKAPAVAASTAPVTPSGANIVAQNRIGTMASANAVRVAMETCQGQNLPFVTVALVDRFGTVQALLRGDNAAEHTIEAAKEKAYTAAAFGAPTSELATRVTGNGPGLADLPGTLFLPGGVPLKVKGVSVAGIGVGGAPDGMLDEKCAAAGAATLTSAAK
ncbi:heme-binding protein [Arthrobacter sp. H35-D1]|uniref:GlcG/HbpS family heme-binding protein n=1 Tax=Arthrobacter sp. H35-D1 TaxID=3046202 RepID=UPI0024BBBB1A|nr:heme-binding protein [Arthrobacter sp. H35-D1]MDJ0315334.1 heme-binding protein [Arthrobacter sp. H35-D1]